MVGLSQEQLAERLRIDRSTVARWEAGETVPQPWIRTQLARALQLSLDQLEHLLTASEVAGTEGTERVSARASTPSSERTRGSAARRGSSCP